MTTLRRAALALPALLLAATVAACGSTAGAAAAGLTVTDPWAKAADSGMTAAFGTLVNDTGSRHHDRLGLVRRVDDGAARDGHERLRPDGHAPEGGRLRRAGARDPPWRPGTTTSCSWTWPRPWRRATTSTITLTADDGAHWTLTFPVRTFTGGNESYQPSASSSAMGTMDGSSDAVTSLDRRTFLQGGAAALGGAAVALGGATAWDHTVGAPGVGRRRDGHRAVPRRPAGRCRDPAPGVRDLRGLRPAPRCRTARRWSGSCGSGRTTSNGSPRAARA